MISKYSLSLLLSISVAMAGVMPTWAEKISPDSSTQTKESSSAIKPDNVAKSNSSSGGAKHALRNVFGFIAGVTCGAPIAIARKCAQESVNATRDLVGDTDVWVFIAAGGVLGVPAGCLSGTVEGLLLSVKNSWKNTAFSKESFSLGDDI